METGELAVVRLCDFYPKDGQWIFTLSKGVGRFTFKVVSRGGRTGELLAGQVPPYVMVAHEPRIPVALDLFRAFYPTTESDHDIVAVLQCLLSSMSWTGLQVEIPPVLGMQGRRPDIANFYPPMLDCLVDSVAEVFGDQQFAVQVLSFCPEVKVAE